LALLLVGIVGVYALRDRPAPSFALSVILMPLGSPVAAGHSWSLLLGALSPLTRPLEAAPEAAQGDQPAPRSQIEPVSPATT